MARRIFIHAGQHKTGTTSIQHYIERHAAVLQQNGIAPFRDRTPDLSGEAMGPLPCNVKLIANALIRGSLQTPMRLSGAAMPLSDEDWQSRLPALRAALQAVSAETVLLSAEAFSFLRVPSERARLDDLCAGFEITAVMFLRDPASFRASWRVQTEHAGYASMPGARAGEGILDLSESSWLTQHAAIRAFWGETCTFLSYETAVEECGSVIPALLRALGLDPSACPPWDDLFLNTGAEKRQKLSRPPS